MVGHADGVRLARGGRRGARRGQPHAALRLPALGRARRRRARGGAARGRDRGARGQRRRRDRRALRRRVDRGDGGERDDASRDAAVRARDAGAARPAASRRGARGRRTPTSSSPWRGSRAFAEELELPAAEAEARCAAADGGRAAVAVGGGRRARGAGRPQRRRGRHRAHRVGLHAAERRGRGYAGAVTAACAADALARGVERVVLFTDLSSPARTRSTSGSASARSATTASPTSNPQPGVRPRLGRASCGRSFGCGAAEGSCWCAEVELDDAARARLAASYDGCLCPACLSRAAAGTLPPPRPPLQARAPGGPAPRPR